MVFLDIMPEPKLKTVRSARFKGIRGRKTGRVCKAVGRQGREAHDRVNICLKGREAHNRVIQGSKRKTSPAVQNAREKGRRQKGLESLAEVKIMKALYVSLRYLDTNIFSTVVPSHIDI